MTKLRVTTELGQFKILTESQAAPATSAYFLTLARTGALDNSSIFRVVSPENGTHNVTHPISVVQGGLQQHDPQSVPPVAHEATDQTGLRHKQWTVSTARNNPGETYGSFFVCLRDEPMLDQGGMRHPDGHGFAAFGRVDSGQEVVQMLYNRREAQEILNLPIAITSVNIEE